MTDIIGKFNKTFEGVEIHMRDIEKDESGKITTKKHNFTGPGTDISKRIKNIDELIDVNGLDEITPSKVIFTSDNSKPISSIDESAMIHDLSYEYAHKKYPDDEKQRLKIIHESDEVLRQKGYNIMMNKNEGLQQRVQGAFIASLMWLKVKIGLGKKGNKKTNKQQEEVMLFIDTHKNILTKNQKEVLEDLLDMKPIK